MNPVPVARDTVVALRVSMFDAQGAPLGAGPETLSYLHGYGGLLAALERSLEGKVAGEVLHLYLEPQQAFGEYDAALLRIEAAERYGEGLRLGMQVEEDSRLYTVTELAAGKAVLDANHPLAGMAVRFSLEVLGVRPATPEEIAGRVSLPPQEDT